MIEIDKQIADSKFEYVVKSKGEKLAALAGGIQNHQTLWLWRYEVIGAESLFLDELQKRFYEDCRDNKCKVLLELTPKREQAKRFMDTGDFGLAHVNYVFEHGLKDLKRLSMEFELTPFKEVSISSYQHAYYESSKGDPQIDLSKLSPETFFTQDKQELDDLWDENLMHLVSFENEVIGVLNLRTMPHPKTKEKEGSINYLGLLPEHRKKGYGEILHLTGLHKLAALGCKSYYGGTGSDNQSMLKIFEKNNCTKAEEQYCYKVNV